MLRQPAFTGARPLLKGALHCHTTRSDGKGTPQEVIRLHKQQGYDFMALTDHRLYNYENFAPETENPAGRAPSIASAVDSLLKSAAGTYAVSVAPGVSESPATKLSYPACPRASASRSAMSELAGDRANRTS